MKEPCVSLDFFILPVWKSQDFYLNLQEEDGLNGFLRFINL